MMQGYERYDRKLRVEAYAIAPVGHLAALLRFWLDEVVLAPK